MNAWLLILVLMGSTAVSAWADEGSYEENTLGVLHYRNPEGGSYLNVNMATRLHDAQTTTQSGSTTNTSTRTSWQSAVTYNYGISDLLSAGVTESYLFGVGASSTAEPSGVTTGSSMKGFSDPTLHVNYRYMGGLNGSRLGSAYLNLQPAIGSHQNTESSRQGNNINVGTIATLGTNIFWVSGPHEWAVGPLLNYTTSGTSNASKPINTSVSDAFFSYGVSGNYRYHASEKLYAAFSLDVLGPFSDNHSYGGHNPVNVDKVKSPAYAVPTLGIGFKPQPHTLVTAQVNYQKFTTTTSRIAGAVAADTSLSHDEELMSVAGAWEF